VIARLDRGDQEGAAQPLRGAAVGQTWQGSQSRLPLPTRCGVGLPRAPTDLAPSLPPAPGGVCFSISDG